MFKYLELHLTMNYNEHVECLNVWFCFCCMVIMYACFSSKHFNFMCMFMGLVSRVDNGMVASSSPFKGSGTLHKMQEESSPKIRYALLVEY